MTFVKGNKRGLDGEDSEEISESDCWLDLRLEKIRDVIILPKRGFVYVYLRIYY